MTSVFIYVAVFVISASFISKSKYRNKVSLSAIIGLGLLILFAAGRYHVGTDCTTYNNIFIKYSNMSWREFFSTVDSEVLFAVVAKVTYGVGGRVLTWGTFAALTAIPTYLALEDDYENLCIGVAFFVFCMAFYVTAFNVTRQFVAVAFVFWGLKFVYNNKLIPFLVTIFVATGFHTSALIAITIWFMWDHKNQCAIRGIKKGGIIVLVAIVVYCFQDIIAFFTSHVSELESYSSYAETSTRGQNRDLFISVFESIIVYIIGYRQRKSDEKYDFMFTLLLISTLIGITGFQHPQVKRNAYYFGMPARLVLFGSLPNAFAKNSRGFVKIFICLYFVGLFVLTAYILGQSDLIPYRFDLFSPW